MKMIKKSLALLLILAILLPIFHSHDIEGIEDFSISHNCQLCVGSISISTPQLEPSTLAAFFQIETTLTHTLISTEENYYHHFGSRAPPLPFLISV